MSSAFRTDPTHDALPWVAPERAYLVCATPRSGSTRLCEALASTGVAGRPEEFFEARRATGRPPEPAEYFDGDPALAADLPPTGAAEDPPAYSSLEGVADYRDHLARAVARGTTQNGVFGAKIMWGHVEDFVSLAGDLPELAGLDLQALLTRVLGSPRYVWVRREDKVRQAVSLWRAFQTRAWREDPDRETRPERELVFSRAHIEHLASGLAADDANWERYFTSVAADPVEVVYERDLEGLSEPATRRVLAHLGVAAPEGWHEPERMRRQADALSEEWVERVRATGPPRPSSRSTPRLA